jgi:hypothetical protein
MYHYYVVDPKIQSTIARWKGHNRTMAMCGSKVLRKQGVLKDYQEKLRDDTKQI